MDTPFVDYEDLRRAALDYSPDPVTAGFTLHAGPITVTDTPAPLEEDDIVGYIAEKTVVEGGHCCDLAAGTGQLPAIPHLLWRELPTAKVVTSVEREILLDRPLDFPLRNGLVPVRFRLSWFREQ
jgi:hypothetical protein